MTGLTTSFTWKTAEMWFLWWEVGGGGGGEPTANARNVKSACMINDKILETWNHFACTLNKLPL